MTDDRPVTETPKTCEELADRMRRAGTPEEYDAAKADYLAAGYGVEEAAGFVAPVVEPVKPTPVAPFEDLKPAAAAPVAAEGEPLETLPAAPPPQQPQQPQDGETQTGPTVTGSGCDTAPAAAEEPKP